jgi:hypothetical protein
MTPSEDVLANYSKEELKAVKSFKVENEFGILEFQGAVDLTYVDLLTAITIDSLGIEVYGEDYANSKPVMGTKLNVPATLT